MLLNILSLRISFVTGHSELSTLLHPQNQIHVKEAGTEDTSNTCP